MDALCVFVSLWLYIFKPRKASSFALRGFRLRYYGGRDGGQAEGTERDRGTGGQGDLVDVGDGKAES